jgi:hypothetical protein
MIIAYVTNYKIGEVAGRCTMTAWGIDIFENTTCQEVNGGEI